MMLQHVSGMIKARGIHKSYGSVEVLKGIDFDVEKGEIVSIVGSSGAGKSTLLHILGTLDRPTAGSVSIQGQDVFKQNDKKLSAFRNQNIGFVFQFHHLLPEFTAVENVSMPAFINGSSGDETKKKATQLLDFMGLADRINHKPSELSGGEQQRVAIARALINDPAIVMADEPTGNLDSDNSEDIHKLFLSLREEFAQTFLVVTHSTLLADLCDRKLTMRDGLFIA